VGSYYAGGGISGFLYNPRTTPAFNSIDYPGALSTYANGINGDGQIVGTYRDLSNNSAGFLYEAGTPSPFNCPGAQSTVPLGINNNGQVVGFYFDSITTYGFLYQAGSCSVVDGFYGINDNTQLAGYVLGIP
jgi:probable HAF family extracellular repeat protein